jgi:PAS domain S-box-containing protein
VKIKIKKKRLIFIFCVSCVIVLASAYIYLRYDADLIRKEKENELSTISNLKLEQITKWMNDGKGHAFVLSDSPFFLENVENWLNNQNDRVLMERIIKRLSSFKTSFGYENLFIVSVSGELLLSVSKDLTAIDESTKKFIVKSVNTGKISDTDFYYCHLHSKIHFDIIAPMRNSYNQIMAVIVLRIDPDSYIFPIIQSWPTSSKTGETLLVEKEGDHIVFLNELRHRKNTALKLKIPLTDTDLPAVQAVLGRTGIFEGKDYREVDVLAKLSAVNNSPWFMVTKIDKNEIFSDLYFKEVLIILFVFFIILISGISLMWIYIFNQKRIYEKLYSKEKALSEATEIFRTTIYSIGDGVITTDISGNVMHLNHIAENLTGWKESDASGKALEEIFRIINEDTSDLVENPVVKVLKEGTIVGLANHTLLLSRDGRSTPIADSGAPIVDVNGSIIGVVLVFRDQTEERSYQKKIQDNEIRYRSTLDNMMEGCQIVGFDWKVIYINDLAASYGMIEKDAAIGRSVLEVYPGIENTEIFSDMKKCMDGRLTVIKEYDVSTKVNMGRWLEVSIQPVPEGIFVLILDISERNKSQAELAKKTDELQSIINNMINAFVVWESVFDENGDYVSFKFGYFNGAYSKITGLDSNEVFGKDVFDVWPETEKEWFDIYREVALTGVSRTFEQFHKPTGGYYKCNAYRPTGSKDYICVIFEDITENKRSGEIIRKNGMLLEKIQSIAHLGGWEYDLEKGDVYWSGEMYRLHDLEPCREMNSLDDLKNIVHPDDRGDFIGKLESSRQSGESFTFVYRTNPEFCPGRFIKSEIQCLMNDRGSVKLMTGICIDITDIKEAEDRIRKGLEEKDILIKELYHRTKNNMMVICSLLSLESHHLNDEKTKEMLKEIENKIKSMALVHQMLYQTKNLTNINLQLYIEELSGLLKSSYSSKNNISFKMDLKKFEVAIDMAIPFGMVLNELITNSFKYAFPENENGEIFISLDKKADDEIELVYSDNGIGIPGNFDILNQKTLGIQTITNIIRHQMQGEIGYSSENGLRYHIKFKDNLYKERI